MTLETLMKELRAIVKVHPEAKQSRVIAVDGEGYITSISYVGYDTKHKPARIKLEE